MNKNLFIHYIESGKIQDENDLKHFFRLSAKQIHPDVSGRNAGSDRFCRLHDQYEEALSFLVTFQPNRKSDLVLPVSKKSKQSITTRYLFYTHFLKILNCEEGQQFIVKKEVCKREALRRKLINELASSPFIKDGPLNPIFESAFKEYDQVRAEKLPNSIENLRKSSGYEVLLPCLYTLCRYHCTGLEFYRKQIDRDLDSITASLASLNVRSLTAFIQFLLHDLGKGAAFFE